MKFMSFVLLKEKVKYTIELMVKTYKADSLNQVQEPRRSELLLVHLVFSKMKSLIEKIEFEETNIEPEETNIDLSIPQEPSLTVPQSLEITPTIKKPQDPTHSAKKIKYFSIFYAAMLIAREHTEDLNGRLATKLAELIGLDNLNIDERPSLMDLVNFYKAFNQFIQEEVFYEGDSRYGFKQNHLLSLLGETQLEGLLLCGYRLEKTAQINLINSLVNNGSAPETYPLYEKNTPLSALKFLATTPNEPLDVKSWKKLRTLFKKLLIDESVDKHVSTLAKLPNANRALQTQFLEQSKDILKLKDTLLPLPKLELEKAAVFAGFLHLVYKEISLSEASGVVYKSLNDILNVKKESPENIESLLQATDHFLRNLTLTQIPMNQALQKEIKIPSVQEQQPYMAIIKEHEFSKIQNFDLKKYLSLLQTTICEKRCEAVQAIFQQMREDKKSQDALNTPHTTWAGSLRHVVHGGVNTVKNLKALNPVSMFYSKPQKPNVPVNESYLMVDIPTNLSSSPSSTPTPLNFQPSQV